ncbi:hypothetical protein PSTT_09625 [Puccinia striiformis]|uniref:OTU domain-containing protein n=1 Tax=Puccinia striiformis TaxID=27350 RepID=A0A2S4V7P6_9BASI|nr:hypothetical protein PSTT_09625 [Puccinia striiformis]
MNPPHSRFQTHREEISLSHPGNFSKQPQKLPLELRGAYYDDTAQIPPVGGGSLATEEMSWSHPGARLMQTQQLPYEHGVYYDNPAQTPSVAEESLTRKKGNQSHIDPRLMQPQNSPYDHHGAYNYNSARSLPLAGRSQTIYLDTQLHAGQKFSDEQFLLDDFDSTQIQPSAVGSRRPQQSAQLPVEQYHTWANNTLSFNDLGPNVFYEKPAPSPVTKRGISACAPLNPLSEQNRWAHVGVLYDNCKSVAKKRGHPLDDSGPALDASITYNRDLRQLPRAASFEEYMIQPHQPISKRAKQVMPEDDDGWVRFDQAHQHWDSPPLSVRSLIYVLHDVLGDGHCGFRAAAISMGRCQREWDQIRREMMAEMNKQPIYKNKTYLGAMPGGLTFEQSNEQLANFQSQAGSGHWMTFPRHGFLLADTYKRPVILISRKMMTTFLPLSYGPTTNPPICMVLVANQQHYNCFEFHGTTYPAPGVSRAWHAWRSAEASQWFAAMQPHFTEWAKMVPLIPQNAVTLNIN